ncbi:MAG: diguanylate cyclase [Xanthomonadales bacterium]|nr:diguanylate cyclase [Xanthomonadales bacterium]
MCPLAVRSFVLGLCLLAGPLLAATGIDWTDEERTYLQAKGTIRFCVDPDWPPLEQIDGQGRHVGMAADFLALMASRGQLTLELVATADWTQSLERVQRGDCDLLSLANATPEREVYLDFTRPYLELPIVVVTRADVQHIASIVQVADRPLGILKGFAAQELFRAKYPGIRLVEIDSYANGFGRVQSGELFGVLGNMASMGHLMQQNKVLDLKIAGWTGEQAQLGIATRKDEPMLAQVFDKLVQSIGPRDTQAIMNRWLAVRFEQGFDYRLFWRTLIIAALVAGLILAWAITLRRFNRRLRDANARLAEANRRDALTGLHNRIHLDHELPLRLRLCSRNRLGLTVAMVDVDHFKRINDSFGHPFGDASLQHVARLLAQSFRRESDLVARYGGEEFIVVIVGTTADEAMAQLEAFRGLVQRSPILFAGEQAGLTVSIGLHASVPLASETPERLIQLADAALYQAKREGRDRVVRSDAAVSGIVA